MHGTEPTGVVRLAGAPALSLGLATLQPPLRRLDGPLASVPLEPRVVQLLLVLGGQAGTVLSRDALLAACWPGVIVGDDSLHRAIAGARRALQQAGAEARIETVPRVGYRLVADAAPPAAEPPAPAAATAQAPVSRRRALWWAGGAALAGVAGAALWSGRRQPAGSPAGPAAALLAEAMAQQRLAEPQASRRAVAALRRAVALVPGDPLLHGRLALAAREAAEFAAPGQTAALLAEAEQAGRRALAADPDQPDARVALALLRPIHGNWLWLERALLPILADWPDHAPALDALSQVEAGAGLVKRHYPHRLRAVALDPLHAAYNFRSIYAHWMNGDLAAADRAADRAAELWPRHLPSWGAHVGLLLYTGRAERALAQVDSPEARWLPPPFRALFAVQARALASGSAADRAKALAFLDTALARGGPAMAVNATLAFAALGASARALAVTEAFLLQRGPEMASPVWKPGQTQHIDLRRRFTNHLFLPIMAPVRALPGFAGIMRDCGLAEYWAQSRHQPDHLAA